MKEIVIILKTLAQRGSEKLWKNIIAHLNAISRAAYPLTKTFLLLFIKKKYFSLSPHSHFMFLAFKTKIYGNNKALF